jgi:hypothetical protein
MTIILRDSLNGQYYSISQTWCAEVSEAMVFASVQEAALMANEKNLASVQVVMHYEDPRCDLALPLDLCLPDIHGASRDGQNPRHAR